MFGLSKKKKDIVCTFCNNVAPVNKSNLCNDCEHQLRQLIDELIQTIDTSFNAAMGTDNKEMFYAHVNTYTENVKQLTVYANMGITFPKELAGHFDSLLASMQEKERQLLQVTAKKTTVNDGTETITEYNVDGTIKSTAKRKVNAVILQKELYEDCKTGVCTVCWDREKKVNNYDICEDCEHKTITDTGSRLHISQQFSLLHRVDIEKYEESIGNLYSDKDYEKLYATGKEFKDFCFSHGAAGEIYIEDNIYRLRKMDLDSDVCGYAQRKAFDWWEFDLQLTSDYSFPPLKNI